MPFGDSELQHKSVDMTSGSLSPLVSLPDASPSLRIVLFVCTGKYYRSRVAEVPFNHHAAKTGLIWTADARGVTLGRGNVGPVSKQVLDWLRAHCIEVGRDVRFPIQLQEKDLAQKDLVIALDETEHRPFLEKSFPGWADRIEHWNIPDLGLMPADVTLPAIEREVQELVRHLSGDLYV